MAALAPGARRRPGRGTVPRPGKRIRLARDSPAAARVAAFSTEFEGNGHAERMRSFRFARGRFARRKGKLIHLVLPVDAEEPSGRFRFACIPGAGCCKRFRRFRQRGFRVFLFEDRPFATFDAGVRTIESDASVFEFIAEGYSEFHRDDRGRRGRDPYREGNRRRRYMGVAGDRPHAGQNAAGCKAAFWFFGAAHASFAFFAGRTIFAVGAVGAVFAGWTGRSGVALRALRAGRPRSSVLACVLLGNILDFLLLLAVEALLGGVSAPCERSDKRHDRHDQTGRAELAVNTRDHLSSLCDG